jgi:hypothetical protein
MEALWTIDIINTIDHLIREISLWFYIAVWYIVFFSVTIWYFTIKFWNIFILFLKAILKITTEDNSSIFMWLWILFVWWIIIAIMMANSHNIIEMLYN